MNTHAYRDLSPESQQRQVTVLRGVLDSIERFAESNHSKPVVEIDLDLSALMPVHRTRNAIEAVARAFGLPEELHRDPALLPGYTDEAWLAFLKAQGIPERYPKLPWIKPNGAPDRSPGTPFAAFHTAFWTTELLVEDEPTPGLCSFAHRVIEKGGLVVFLSGRWLPEQVKPTVECLHRSGLGMVPLLIGNDRHESLVEPSLAVSDSQLKAQRQVEIRDRYGVPIAIVDDRAANRRAVSKSNSFELLEIAISIPGFTSDPQNFESPKSIRSFELYTHAISDPPLRPWFAQRHQLYGFGAPWAGLYEGIGANRLPYVCRRVVSKHDEALMRNLSAFDRPYVGILNAVRGSISEEDLITLCESTIPTDAICVIDKTIEEAKRLAGERLAHPFPEDPHAQRELRLTTLVSWLHSRDIGCLLAALGFNIPAQGIHDLNEEAPAAEVRRRILSASAGVYSEWLRNLAEQLGEDGAVNVGCLNPSLTVGMYHWSPRADRQDAMDVHRLSSHHEGDCAERYDPIEAAINNLLHRREGKLGIRKERQQTWGELERLVSVPTKGYDIAKTGVASVLYRDVLTLARTLESGGFLTPWQLAKAD
jgi:hypothetical protein